MNMRYPRSEGYGACVIPGKSKPPVVHNSPADKRASVNRAHTVEELREAEQRFVGRVQDQDDEQS